MNIEELKKLSQIDLAKLDGNEQNVKYNIVLHFLNCFGYDKLDLEHAAQGSRIDINIGNKIIVETKALNKNLDNYITQVQQYCNTERPDLAILTNGQSYRFYSPFMRVASFTETLIYEFAITDFSNEEVVERVDKLIGVDNYTNGAYLRYIEERENELKQIRKLFDDFDKENLSRVQSIETDIEQIKSEMKKLESELNLKQQEIIQINSKNISEKEELFKKHFIPSPSTTFQTPKTKTQPSKIITQPELIDNSRIYEINNAKAGVNAKGKYYVNKKFTVLLGSSVSLKLDTTFGKGAADSAYELRKDLENTGIIINNREFTEDYTFNSISQAACVVLGGSRNGKKEWK